MEHLSLSVKLPSGNTFLVDARACQTVFELKGLIAKQSGLLERQQRLVFNGKILNDNLSLSFYKLREKSNVYLVPVKRTSPTRPNPKMMVEKLRQLIADIRIAPPSKANEMSNDIRDLTTNPMLLSYASISSDALQVIEEAQSEIEDLEQDIEDESAQYIAQATDTALNQIEASSDGLRTLTSIMEEDERDEDEATFDISFDEPTVIEPKAKRISDSPLPLLMQNKAYQPAAYLLPTGQEFHYDLSDEDFWCETDFKRYIKQKYAQQVAILKHMGFDDEQIILQALGETNGNVQLAFQILQSRLFFQC